MDLKAALLREHNRKNALVIAEYIGDDKERFADLMKIFFGDDHRLTQRAAWPINLIAEMRPQMTAPHIKKFIDILTRDDLHSGVKRNIMRLLQFVDIPERFIGKFYSHCIDLLENPNEPVAVKAFAVHSAVKIANGTHELLDELRMIVGPQLADSTPALHSVAKKLFSAAEIKELLKSGRN